MSINLSLVHKLLKAACHPTTNVNEAHSAAVRAGEALSRAGSRIEDLIIDAVVSQQIRHFEEQLSKYARQFAEVKHAYETADLARAELKSDNDRLLQLNEVLQAALRKKDHELEAATARIEELQAVATQEMQAHRSDTGSEYVDFAAFANAAAAKCGRPTWKSAVAFALGMTVRELTAWSVVGIFPANLAAQVDALSKEERAPPSRQRWTKEEVDRLKDVLNTGCTDFQAAVRLTHELGRRVLETSVASKRRRLLSTDCWLPVPSRIRQTVNLARILH